MHSPLPWRVVGEDIKSGNFFVAGALDGFADGGMTCDANSAFIVRAVNSHDALLAALEAVREYMRDDDEKLSEEVDPEWAALVRRVRAVVAKVEGNR